MKVLIFGASGATGHQLVVQALTGQVQVSAFVRTPKKLKITHPNLKVITGDVTDALSVQEAIEGQHVVLSALGAASPFHYDASIVAGMANIINSMEFHQVRRLIYLSFAGVEQSRPQAGFIIKYIAPRLLATEIAGHQQREKLIEQSRLDWTIVRAPTLTNGKHLAKFRTGPTIESKGFMVSVSRADVADFMLSQLTDQAFIHKKPLILY